MKSFSEIIEDQTKTAVKIPQSDYLESGKYRIFDQGKDYSVGFSNDENGVVDNFPYIIFGDHTRVVKFVNEPCFIGADGVKLLKVINNNFDSKYVYYNILAKPIESQGYARHFKFLKEIHFSEKSLPDQQKIAAELDTIQSAINNKKQQLSLLDEAVKSEFVEMFGDPVINEKGWKKVRLDSVADIKIGPFGSLLHREDYISGGHSLVNPSHIIDGIIETDEKLTIADKKYEELTPYHLKKNDVVMGRRGEMGRCAVVKQEGLLCGTGSLIIRTKGDLEADFIQKIISFPSYKKTIEDKAVGQTMPNLNVPIVSSFEIIKPPKKVQNKYYFFVQQIDKSKFIVKQQIADLQELLDSKMQEYFS